jgi:polysaccharide biosynthesis/export protein
MIVNVLLSMLLALTLAPQNPLPAPPAANPPAPADARATPDSYVIGPNDTLDITIFGEPDLTNKYRVDEAGSITFPMIGRVPVGGKRIVQFQDDLRKQLSDYIRNPQVRVDVDTYKSQAVFVSGAVRAPGRFVMTGQTTLLNALTQAGSPNADAGDDIQIAHSRGPVDPGAPVPTVAADDEPRHVSYRSLQLGRGDVVLQDGDIVYVPPAQHFTITGQVKSSGQYVWEPDLTVEQAIARAGGLTERGSSNRIKVTRVVDGKAKEFELKIRDRVLANDAISVGQRFF